MGKLNGCIFLIENDDLLEKYNTVLDKVSTDVKKEFDSRPVYKNEFLKTKIKSHCDEVTGFYNKIIPKVKSNYTYLAVITLDSAFFFFFSIRVFFSRTFTIHGTAGEGGGYLFNSSLPHPPAAQALRY